MTFSTWGNGEDRVFGDIPIVRANRRPCPVCGHPTGDCTGGSGGPSHVVGFQVRKADKDRDKVVLVPEDIFEDVWLTPGIKSRVLVARAGTYMTREKAARYGLLTSE